MSTSDKGTLYLIPNTLGKTPENNTIPEFVLDIIRRLDVLIVENVQSTARYLQWVDDTIPEYEIDFLLLNKKTPGHEMASFLDPLKKGTDAGLISEAGCPAVADPGSELISMAHSHDIMVSPLVGPSSILLALMGSGFNGQQFTFHGYLPIEQHKRRQAINELEQEASSTGYTQIFMEAPYRNDAVVGDVLEVCAHSTKFCAASSLTLPDERIISKRISDWQQQQPELGKNPAIFLLQA